MPTTDIYGFANDDMEAARTAVERALSIRLEEAQESTQPGGYYFRVDIPSGPTVQLRCNSGPYQGSHPWYPAYGVLVFVHGPAPESIADRLKYSVPGLLFLETRESM